MKIKKLSVNLEYTWWAYLAIALTAVILWTAVFSSLARPKGNEKITIEVFAGPFDSGKLSTVLTENQTNITDQPLKEISVTANISTTDMLYQLIQTRIITSDIMIFSTDLLTEDENGEVTVDPSYYFAPLPTELLNTYFSGKDIKYFSVEDKAYGVYIDLEEYGTDELQYVAFFSTKSVNLGEMNTKGNKTDTAALDIAAFLMGEKE